MTKHAMNVTTNANLEAALSYAARGWHVFPLRPGSKKPATPTHPADRCDGTDPRCASGHTGWEQRATSCVDRITRAWARTPALGVGIACGPSHLVVVDLDTAKPDTTLPTEWNGVPGVVDGADVLAVLAERAGQPWPLTRSASTPSGGTHLYFTAPAEVRLRNTAGFLGPMVDTRSHGGYVAAPPTTTPAGGYELVDDIDAAPLPSWLVTALTPPPRPDHPGATLRASGICVPRYVAAALTHEVGRVVHASPGTRNQALFVSALALGQFVGAGVLGAEQVTAALHDAAAGHVAAGAFSVTEAAATIASGLRRGIADPRILPQAQSNTGAHRTADRNHRECA